MTLGEGEAAAVAKLVYVENGVVLWAPVPEVQRQQYFGSSNSAR